MDELTPLRLARQSTAELVTAWFVHVWSRLNSVEREAIVELMTELHDAGLRRHPVAMAWLDQHRHG
jgi:hypothetical protein